MAIHIRSATMQDYPALAAVGRESQELHHQAYPTIFQLDTEGFTPEHVRDLIEGEHTEVYVAEEDGQILGYAFLLIEQRASLDLFRSHAVAEITDIAVTARMRSRGVGRQLFAAAQTWASERGAERMELEVWEFNAGARSFYERLGMQTLARKMSLNLEQ